MVHPVVHQVPMVHHVLEHPVRRFVIRDMVLHLEMDGVNLSYV